MMCVTWRVKQDLSNFLVDLYQNFVHYLPDHLEKKTSDFAETTEAKPHSVNTPLLQEVASLAFSFDENGWIVTNFDEDFLRIKCPNYLHQIKELGYITHFLPSSSFGTSSWGFSHQTLQEYFIADHIKSSSTGAEQMIELCSGLASFQNKEVIMKFLCGMDSRKANNIISHIVSTAVNEQECNKLLNLLLRLVPFYKRQEDILFPLPAHVEINDETNGRELQILFKAGYDYQTAYTPSPMVTLSGNISLLRKYKLGNIGEFYLNIEKIDSDYTMPLPKLQSVQKVMVNITEEEVLLEQQANEVVVFFTENIMAMNYNTDEPSISNATEKILEAARDRAITGMKTIHAKQLEKNQRFVQLLFQSLSAKHLTCLVLKGRGVLQPLCSIMKALPSIREAGLFDSDETFHKNDLIHFCEVINEQKNLNKLQVDVAKCGGVFCSIKRSIEMELCLSCRSPQFNHLEDFYRMLRSGTGCPHIRSLALSNQENNRFVPYLAIMGELSHEDNTCIAGGTLAQTLHKLPAMHTLKLEQHVISRETLENMMEHQPEQEMKDSQFAMKKIRISENDLCGGGSCLGKLIKCSPQLQVLELSSCDLSNKDIDELEQNLPESSRLQKMHIENNLFIQLPFFFERRTKESTKFRYLWKHFPELEALDLINCCIDKSGVNDLLDPNELKCLRVLDLSFNNFSEQGLEELGDYIVYLERLEALSIAHCQCNDVGNLRNFLRCLPRSVTHLDISRNDYSHSVTEIIEEKNSIASLRKLNVGRVDEDAERNKIRKELAKGKLTTQVYYDDRERLSALYYDEK